MRKLIKYGALFLLAGILLYINPKDIYHHYKSEERLTVLMDDSSVLKAIRVSPVNEVTSLGNGMYLVTTESNKLIVDVDHKPAKTIYTIFQHKTSIAQFSP
ncbi:hypothetical protein [Sporosarcina sp. G11-34]|uniref:hypothetical protein n=1 Tax=Sporosarcina sp. G11-34 TaxID=2849605 RepID=UPI0022A9A042|nr:hypothetical protein [Sporosarcina sp. G11-34]MCZ2260740.1 hypothetical protein [Sporosarcina sp. G11-34]